MPESSLDRDRLYRLIDVGRSLLETFSLDEVLDRVLTVAREVTGARYAAVGVLGPDRRELERFITSGVDPEVRREIGELPRGRGILGVLIEDPRPLRLTDIGSHPRSYGFPAGHPPMRTFLGVPILIRGQAWGNLYLSEKSDGQDFDVGDEESLVILAEWAALAIDHARLHEADRARGAELEHSIQALESTIEIARAVGGETDLERVLELISKRGRALVEARWLAIMLSEGPDLVVAATAGELERDLAGVRMPVAGTAAGSALRSGRSELVAEVSAHVSVLLPGELGVDAKSALFVPLVFRGRALGVVLAVDRLRAGPAFHPDDIGLMEGFAASAATAIATARSVEADVLRRSLEAAEEERQRWARDLHDETLQALAALKVQLAATRRRAPESLVAELDAALAHLQAQINELRRLIVDVRPAALDDLGLGAGLEALVEHSSTSARLTVELDADLAHERGSASSRLAPEIESTLYRIVQEALNNVIKHADATRVEISVREHDGSVEVSIADDGVGFDERRAAGGFGLRGMRERAALVRGRVSVESRVGGGTTVRVLVPALRAEAAADQPRRAAISGPGNP